ncbi:Integrase catalytic region [Paenibacillus sp. JDR-2]|nr:Integrase catalytic region [Paenibacillus sp. JDR-2]
MGVSRSGYYKWLIRKPDKRAKRRKHLKIRIRYHFEGFKRRYGSPKIAAKLREEGWVVATKTVASLMKKMGLVSCVVKKYKATTNSKHSLPVFENVLNREFKVAKPHHAWVADITYVPTSEGWVYLATLMDLYSRKIVGWAMNDRINKELTLAALNDAYERENPGPGLIHHSDRGSQYAANEYRAQVEEYKMVGSMSRKGNCYDNACIESFHSVLKKELVYQTKFRSRKQAYEALNGYIELEYNRIRIHSTLGYKSPVSFEKLYYQQLQVS